MATFDPLAATAEQMAPAPAGSSFFDSRDSTDIIARYARTGRELAGARQRLEDQAAVENLNQNRAEIEQKRILWDRDRVNYEEEEDYKQTRGALLEGVASLDPDSDDYEVRLGEFLSNAPQLAANDDAVQALIRVKQNRFEARRQEERDRAREERMMRDADRRANERIQLALADEGVDIQPFVNPETGDFDAYAATRSIAANRRGREQERQLREEAERADKEDSAYFEKDPGVLDAVRSGDQAKVATIFESRMKDLPASFDPARVREQLTTDTIDTFVARFREPILAKAQAELTDKETVDKQLQAAEATARAIYSAARGLGKLARDSSSSAAPAPAPKSRNPWLDEALKSIKQD